MNRFLLCGVFAILMAGPSCNRATFQVIQPPLPRDGGMALSVNGTPVHYASYPVAVFVSAELTHAQMKATIMSLAYWNSVSGVELFVMRIVPGEIMDQFVEAAAAGHRLQSIGVISKDLGCVEGSESCYAGLTSVLTDPITGNIVSAVVALDDGLDEYQALFTAIHEFGHSVGLLHDGDKNSVMYPIAAASTGIITDEDLAAVVAATH